MMKEMDSKKYEKLLSVIIPHRNALQFLSKLLSTVPEADDVEVIVVDNSPVPIAKGDVDSERDFTLLYSAPERGAGGARNVGMENAHGKWLIFADADDYFTENAFTTFLSNASSEAELIYFMMDAIYHDTGEPANRVDGYKEMIKGYVNGSTEESRMRLCYSSPCSKMVSAELVSREHLRYDEVVASNDTYFSMLCGYYAKKMEVVAETVYVVTVSKGSLTRRRDLPVVESRFLVKLRYNQFVKQHGYGRYQKSVMIQLKQVVRLGIRPFLHFLWLLAKYRQNPMVGYKRWIKSYRDNARNEKREKDYIV